MPGMAAAPYDLEIEQGTDYERELTITQEVEGSPPLDLTGCTFRAQIRPNQAADAGLLADLGPHLTVVDAPAGEALLLIPGAVSSGWAWRAGVWDLELVDSGGRSLRLLKGAVRVSPEVTR